jgi:hypothetical protein
MAHTSRASMWRWRFSAVGEGYRPQGVFFCIHPGLKSRVLGGAPSWRRTAVLTVANGMPFHVLPGLSVMPYNWRTPQRTSAPPQLPYCSTNGTHGDTITVSECSQVRPSSSPKMARRSNPRQRRGTTRQSPVFAKVVAGRHSTTVTTALNSIIE